MTDLAKYNRIVKELNQGSFFNPKVKIVNSDAFKYVENSNEFFDVIIVDLPDPNNSSLARLYSREFYKVVRKKLSKDGLLVSQSTSPYFSSEAYWCAKETLKAAGFRYTYPYHVYVPSFGDWGFVMASNVKYDLDKFKLTVPTKYLDKETFKKAFVIEKDIIRNNIKYSTLDKPAILDYYLQGWRYWN